ncbi:LysR family transcriptional regulator [Pectobacterium cacticida]|uniref:putrescine utilization regulator PtrR n=1 Tax=Pectobacterium cacticida TaxID=69221 RepID=UPI002FF106F1
MDLTQLRMFCLVAETGSVARAAEQLHRVPSNLTTRLRQLEQELGSDLFIREKQRLRLSPIGHNFLCYAQRILALSEEAIGIMHTGEPAGNFALGAIESTAATRLPALLGDYHQRYPTVSLSLTTGTSLDIIERVRAGTLAAAFVNGPAVYDELNGCACFTERLVLISDPKFAPIRYAQDASHQTLFAFGPGSAYRKRIENWFHQSGVVPDSVVEIPSYHAMLASVASGAGIAVLPYAVLASLPAGARVQVHELPADIADVTTWLVWRRGAFGPNVEALKKLIIEQTSP